MASKSRDEIQAFIERDRRRVADAVATLMKADPSDRRVVLLAKLFQHAVSPDPERRQIGADYYSAWVTVNNNGVEASQEVVIRHVIDQEIKFERQQHEERETMRKLAERVENLEAMLGQVLNRLPE